MASSRRNDTGTKGVLIQVSLFAKNQLLCRFKFSPNKLYYALAQQKH